MFRKIMSAFNSNSFEPHCRSWLLGYLDSDCVLLIRYLDERDIALYNYADYFTKSDHEFLKDNLRQR